MSSKAEQNTIEQLVTFFGFPRDRSRLAVEAIGDKTDAQMACNWLLDHGEEDRGGTVEMRICEHADHANAGLLDRARINTDAVRAPRCLDGCSSGEVWMCLCCGDVRCSRYVNGHNLSHFRATRAAEESLLTVEQALRGKMALGHFAAIGIRDLSVWCYHCSAYVTNPHLEWLREQVEIAKFGAFGGANADADVDQAPGTEKGDRTRDTPFLDAAGSKKKGGDSTSSSGACSVFEQTRLAQALEAESDRLDKQLMNMERAVDLDEQNGHVWTIFAKVRRVDDLVLSDDISDRYIERVQFCLHPTFQPSIVKRRQSPFEVRRIGWGVFTILVIIALKGDSEEVLEYKHTLDFSRPKTSEVYQHKAFQIEVGNTYICADDNLSSNGNQQVERYNRERSQRRRLLEASKQKYDHLRHAEKQLASLLQSIPEQRHDMALGAYLAGVYRGNISTDYLMDLYEFATDNLCYVVLDQEKRHIWRDYVMNWQDHITRGDVSTLGGAYALSKPLPPTERIDLFVSHCWSDGHGQAKADLLEAISREFNADHGRPPRLWLDMFCMPQADRKAIAKNVAALPLFLKACDSTVVFYNKALFSRLWCLVEIYTAYILSPQGERARLQFYPLPDQRRKAITVWIQDAKCGLQQDQDLLFKNFQDAPGGLQGVEEAVNTALRLPYVYNSSPQTEAPLFEKKRRKASNPAEPIGEPFQPKEPPQLA